MTSSSSADKDPSSRKTSSRQFSLPERIAAGITGVLAGLLLIGMLLLGFMLAMAYPNLPAPDSLTDYRPKIPLRIFSADHVLIGEFGEERRNVVHFKEIPDVMKKAVLAIEDDRFYEQDDINYTGIVRAALHNLTGGAKQGAAAGARQGARGGGRAGERARGRRRY